MISKEHLAILDALTADQLTTNQETSELVSFKCGGQAELYCAPTSIETFQTLLIEARKMTIPVFILGGGTNVVFRNENFQGLILSTVNLNYCVPSNDGYIIAGAGLSVADLTAVTLDFSLSGFEWASGLPGSIGGGVFMNARCYGSSFSNIIEEITYIDDQGILNTISKNKCKFDYKDSIFQHQPWVIVEARIKFLPDNPVTIRANSDANFQDRLKKHQFDYPSAGCIFKNVYSKNLPAGQLIEKCGLKGHAIGGIRIYEHHANFFVNNGQGTTTDIENLIHFVQQEVQSKEGIHLEPEIRLIG